MDPVQKLWMYENWLADQGDEAEFAKNNAYLLASFWNPEAVQKLMNKSNVHESTSDEFEESLRMVKESINEEVVLPRRRRRSKKVLNKNPG